MVIIGCSAGTPAGATRGVPPRTSVGKHVGESGLTVTLTVTLTASCGRGSRVGTLIERRADWDRPN